jgi:hypothetical protein
VGEVAGAIAVAVVVAVAVVDEESPRLGGELRVGGSVTRAF